MLAHCLSLIALFSLLGTAAAQPPPGTPRMQAPRVELGVLVQPPPPGAVRPGILIREVTPGSPAEKAGLRPGDLILKAGDKFLRSYDDLLGVLANHKPGDKLVLRILRQNKESDVTVTLAEHREAGGPRPMPPRQRTAYIGIMTEPITPQDRARLGVSVDSGLVIRDVLQDSPASRAGLKRDDVITHFDGEAVADPEQLRQEVGRAGVGKEVTLTIVRGKDTKSVKVKLAEMPQRNERPRY